MPNPMQLMLHRLLTVTSDCRDDMHEPDEQGLSARVFGDHLDNAMGDQIDARLMFAGSHEFVVILERDTEFGKVIEPFNLASLIALARKAKL